MAAAVARQQETEMLAKLDDGKLRLERRNGAPGIYASTYLQGQNIVKTTGEQTLSAATKVATDWYLELRDRIRKKESICTGARLPTWRRASSPTRIGCARFQKANAGTTRKSGTCLRSHFDGVKVTDVDTKFLLELRETRSQAKSKKGVPVGRRRSRRTGTSSACARAG